MISVTSPACPTGARSRQECDGAALGDRGRVTDGLVLSVFPGIDLLGAGFESAGFCVVRGPDPIFGGDIRSFHPLAGSVQGVIGGPPCQDFSKIRRAPPTGYGREMLEEFCRIVQEAAPTWWLMENVERVPGIDVPGYTLQKFNLNAAECGGIQRRPRVFFFGTTDGMPIVIDREIPVGELERPVLATEGTKRHRRGWEKFCALQGLPTLELSGWSIKARYAAVGNGVPVYMARRIAIAIRDRRQLLPNERLCICGCGRVTGGRHLMATAACRKRMQRRRETTET